MTLGAGRRSRSRTFERLIEIAATVEDGLRYVHRMTLGELVDTI